MRAKKSIYQFFKPLTPIQLEGSLRGLHYQLVRPQMKLVYVVRGEILDVAVDIRYGSPSFGYWHSTILNEQNHKQLIIPGDFAHGFCVSVGVCRFDVLVVGRGMTRMTNMAFVGVILKLELIGQLIVQFSQKKIKFVLFYQKYRENICLYTKNKKLLTLI